MAISRVKKLLLLLLPLYFCLFLLLRSSFDSQQNQEEKRQLIELNPTLSTSSKLNPPLPLSPPPPSPTSLFHHRNIIFISIDDLRPELGAFYENQEIKTPNLNALMRDPNSFTFTHAYSQYPVCSPSRASVLTGLRPDKTRVYDLQSYFRETAILDESNKITTLFQVFKSKGYLVYGMGKLFHTSLDSGYD